MPAVAVVVIELAGRVGGKADVEIDLTVAVEVAPGRGARLDGVGKAGRGGHVLEAALILAIQAIRPAAKADELVEITVVVEVGPGVGLAAVGGEEIGLNEIEERGHVALSESKKRDGYQR